MRQWGGKKVEFVRVPWACSVRSPPPTTLSRWKTVSRITREDSRSAHAVKAHAKQYHVYLRRATCRDNKVKFSCVFFVPFVRLSNNNCQRHEGRIGAHGCANFLDTEPRRICAKKYWKFFGGCMHGSTLEDAPQESPVVGVFATPRSDVLRPVNLRKPHVGPVQRRRP